MLRVVADTNIYVSALNFGGAPLRLLRLAERGRIRLVASAAILDETSRVLRLKFAWPETRVARVIEGLHDLTEHAEPTHTLDLIPADPTDNRILECADAAGADYVVSGDRHLLSLKRHGAAPIVKVAEFPQRLQE